MRPPLLLASLLVASPVFGEILYNGISLPDVWSPKLPELTRALRVKVCPCAGCPSDLGA